MGHEDSGSYADKHPHKNIDRAVADRLRQQAKNNCITCAAAHRTAGAVPLSPEEIGVQVDLLEYRIIECQMGLFGYPDKKKRVDPGIDLPGDLETALIRSSSHGRISCRECWEIAARFKVKRVDIGSACEKMEIRIKPCQLGAF